MSIASTNKPSPLQVLSPATLLTKFVDDNTNDGKKISKLMEQCSCPLVSPNVGANIRVQAFFIAVTHLCSMDENISIATVNDIPELLQLINNAYRGEEAKKGWTHEADLIEGSIRTDEDSLKQLIQKPNAVMLKYMYDEKITGCVYLEKKEEKLYLGMLSVSPEIQAQGIGKKLLKTAEEHARKNNCSIIEMTVISIRNELIVWYERNGYHKTTKKEPFPVDGRFGNPRQQLEFVYLQKQL